MAVDRSAVIAIAPELGDVAADDGRWAAFIADADLFASTAKLGVTRGDAAKKYLVAHWMTASVDAGSTAEGGGALSSVTIGPVTKTFDTSSTGGADHSDLKSTRYGAMFLSLIRVAAIGVI